MKVMHYTLFCTGKDSHKRTGCGELDIEDAEDAKESWRILSWKGITFIGEMFRTPNGEIGRIATPLCRRCPNNPRVYTTNLVRAVVGISDATGVFDIDISKDRLDSRS